ncbi:MAG: Maf family protein [Deinococcota bacterium]
MPASSANASPFKQPHNEQPRIVLASRSPRRQALLNGLGFTFEVQPADIDETPQPHEQAYDLVTRLSASKARAIAQHHPDALIIAADTTVVLGEQFLEKPRDLAQKREFISLLAGKPHTVLTGHAVAYGETLEQRTTSTQVYVRDLGEQEIDWYVSTGEGLDKAGGYAIQGHGAALVDRIEGCYFNVVGMSVATVFELCQNLGVPLV